jgi:geranylgeranyl pyrophosphate synthase
MRCDGPLELIEALRFHTPALPGGEAALRATLDHLTRHPGKLLRARLVLESALRCGWSKAAALKLACAIEYFHVASLTLDDLPCMDDAEERRGQACVHRQHGEATTILAALALINRAYHLVHLASAEQAPAVQSAAAGLLDLCLGSAGLVGGQARDLAYHRETAAARECGRIAVAKTGALFSLALQLPAAAADLSAQESRALHALCVYWGLAFQTADDIRDVISSSCTEGKSTGRDRALDRPNFALAAGLGAARNRLGRLETLAHRTLARLCNADIVRWSHLASFQAEAAAVLRADPARSAA